MPTRLAPAAPMARNHSQRFATCVLAGLMAGGSVLWMGGCDTESGQADKRVKQDISQAMPKLNGNEADRSQAQKLLNDAAGQANATAGLPQRILAKGLLAQSELTAAEVLQPKIDVNQAKINRLAWEIDRLGMEVQSRNQLEAALAKYDPASAQTAIKKNITDVQGSASQPDWIKSDAGAVQSLATVTNSIASSQSQIKELQATIQNLTDQRNKLVAQADKLSQQSDNEKGDQAVADFKQASAAQKQAADLSVQIDQANVKLTRARADLSTQEGQQAVLNEAVKDFGGKSDAVDANWTTISNQIKAMKESVAKDLLGNETQAAAEDPTGGKTIASKAARMAELAKANRALRDEAEQHLNNAAQFFDEAVKLADQQQRDLKTREQLPENAGRPDVEAWNEMINALNPARFRLQKAGALVHRAELFAGRAAEAATRQQVAATLTPILKDADLTLPESLQDNDGKIAEDVKSGREKALESYKDADQVLSDVIQGSAPEPQKLAANIAKMFADYGWSLTAAAAGDATTAQSQLAAAKIARDSITPASAMPQSLPPALAVAPAGTGAAPGMNPAAPASTSPGAAPTR